MPEQKKHPASMTEDKVKLFKDICRMNPTLADAAAVLDVSEDTIYRYLKNIGISFADFREQNLVFTRMSLIRNALKMAHAGNSALMIFCLKNLCGWSDKQEIKQESTVTSNNIVVKDKKELLDLMKELKEIKINES